MKQRAKERTIMDVHYINFSMGQTQAPCGEEIAASLAVSWTPDVELVTCRPCAVELAAQAARLRAAVAESGRLADEVDARERGARTLARQLAEVKATEAKALEELAGWARVLADSVALREKLEARARLLSGPVSQDHVLRDVPLTPQGFLDSLRPYAAAQRMQAGFDAVAEEQRQRGTSKPMPY